MKHDKLVKLSSEQQKAFKSLLSILQQKGKQYVYTQGHNMECLNQMYKIRVGNILGHLSINDDGSPLADFKKSFMI